MRNKTVLTTALLIAWTAAAPAQTNPPLSVMPLDTGVYWVKGGSGANTGFIIGKSEVVVIDAKTDAASAKSMLAEIGKLTPNPVKSVILTHSDGDHVNGLSGFPKGLRIIAHTKTKGDMEAAFRGPGLDALLPYLPNDTESGDRSLVIDGLRVNLRHFGPAHTSGDLIVFLPDRKIAFVGDLVFLGRDPLIHRQKGGTSFGLVKNLDAILALDATTFIAGHTDPLTKTDIRGLRTSIEEKQAKVKALIGQGRSLEDVKRSFGMADPPQPARRWPSLVEIIYNELTANK